MFEVKVVNKVEVAQRIATFSLEPIGDDSLPEWAPGAHIDVEVPTADGSTLLRQYSLCSLPSDPYWRIAVLETLDSRGGSQAMHAAIEVGQVLQVSEPRNNFPLHDDDSPAILVAGGIGITPMIPMSWALYGRSVPFVLHYQYRDEQAAAFRDELLKAPFAASIRFASDQDSNPKEQLPAAVADADTKSHLYSCGPAGFIDAAETAAAAEGLSAHRIHRELFSAVQSNPNDETDQAFELELSLSGIIVTVPEGKTAAMALEEVGVEVPVSCEQGLCGSCLTKVLEGEPDHRDAFLLPEERKRGDYFTPCCSRAIGDRLVIEL